jgi:hypothetical protein
VRFGFTDFEKILGTDRDGARVNADSQGPPKTERVGATMPSPLGIILIDEQYYCS